jgi:hypothetical protein
MDHCPAHETSEPKSAPSSPDVTRESRPSGISQRSTLIQAKLSVGPAGDRYEQEADRVAAAVMRHIREASSGEHVQISSESNDRVQPMRRGDRIEIPVGGDLQGADGGGVRGRVRAKSAVAVVRSLDSAVRLPRVSRVQAKAATATIGTEGGALDADTNSKIRRATGSGKPLEDGVRRSMEGGFGADFSAVRVHDNAGADDLNQRIQAKAFTTGSDIFFRQGEYKPASTSGQELLAHELTHVVQQGGSQIRREIGDDDTTVTPSDSDAIDADIEEDLAQYGEYDTLANLVRDLQASHEFWVKDDAILLKILRGPFEANWFKAKACLTMGQWPADVVQGWDSEPPHDACMELMKGLVKMRSSEWSKFTAATQKNITAAVTAQKTEQGFKTLKNPDDLDANFKLGDSSGSDSVTSDIDLPGKGENTEIGLRMINQNFGAHFKVDVEPGALFDINVYSSDWMFGGDETTEGSELRIKPTEEGELGPANQKKKDDQNEIWSMVKIRRNMTPAEWVAYKTMVIDDLTDDDSGMDDARDEMNRRFETVEANYESYENNVRERLDNMVFSVDHEDSESAFARDRVDLFGKNADEMEARNRLYEESALRVKGLRLMIVNLKLEVENGTGSPDTYENTLLQLHNEIANGLTYANEVYATQGAVLHTVYGKQGATKKLAKLKKSAGNEIDKVEYELTKEMYLQSLNENVGDTLHSLHDNESDPQYAVYRAGKYIDRMCDAALQLVGEDTATGLPAYVDLCKIGDQSVKEKGDKAGKDPKAVQADDSYFSTFTTPQHLADVKAQTMQFGAKATVAYKRQVADLDKPQVVEE